MATVSIERISQVVDPRQKGEGNVFDPQGGACIFSLRTKPVESGKEMARLRLELCGLYGLLAPAGTPRPIIDKLNGALRTALATPEVQRRLATEGAEPLPSSPEEYAADIDGEEAKWSKVIKDAGIKAE